MAGLNRRQFLQLVSLAAASTGLSQVTLGSALAAPLAPATEAPSTLLQTIRQRSTGNLAYRTLVAHAGEPYLPRLDILGARPAAGRVATRRSLYYLGHMSDIHVIDAQAPARVEPLLAQSVATWNGSSRPQDTLTVNILAQMVTALNALQVSPLTGSPVAAFLNTGDSSDSYSQLELDWYIRILDGGEVTPNSGQRGVYEGMQAWLDTQMIYHPEDPSGDAYGYYGFPRIPGLLDAAVSQTVTSPGLAAPWYTVFGNHDALFFGFFPVDAALRGLAVGQRKPYEWQALVANYLRGWSNETTALGRLTHMLQTQFGRADGIRTVTADSSRAMLTRQSFMAAHLASPATPGPVGHGFTPDNVSTGNTYWRTAVGTRLQVFGLDTCNTTLGADGAVPQDQFDWLRAGLEEATANNQLAIVMSHHNSLTLENGAQPAFGATQPLIHADAFIAMLHEYPNLIAWINGHTHNNTIQAHPAPGGDGGFWEITTASCIDFPQQQQMIEIVDNRDGTMSLFTTVVDHTSPAEWTPGDFSQVGLASLSRELASNDFTENPLMRRGAPDDRNTELLLPAPFDLGLISDGEVEAMHAALRARSMAVSAAGAES
ncbi:MAG: hypothetical protein QG597_1976 [Actinomycetota bacterium]|nr:hypothetical protein [Actinomycetota bacterium]